MFPENARLVSKLLFPVPGGSSHLPQTPIHHSLPHPTPSPTAVSPVRLSSCCAHTRPQWALVGFGGVALNSATLLPCSSSRWGSGTQHPQSHLRGCCWANCSQGTWAGGGDWPLPWIIQQLGQVVRTSFDHEQRTSSQRLKCPSQSWWFWPTCWHV